MERMTKAEEQEFNRLQGLWAVRKASRKQILRALDLKRKGGKQVQRED